MDPKDCRLLVTPTSYANEDPQLLSATEEAVGQVIYNTMGRPLESDEVARLLVGVQGYIAGVDVIDGRALAEANELRVISRYGAGVDNIDLNAAREKGIIVTNTPGANSSSVAELTIAFMLNLSRQIPQALAATRGGKWLRISGLTLEGKTVGLIGMGCVGKQVVRRLVGFDCRIVAHDPKQDRVFAVDHGVRLFELDQLLRESDIVSLHLPLLIETRRLVNETFISKMKRGAFLINTSRGELVDEGALCQALASGHLLGVAMDVLAKEPPSPANPLLGMPRVIVTPHMGAHTDAAMRNMGWQALSDCLRVLRSEPPLHRVI